MLNSVEHHDLHEMLKRYRENKNERTDYERLVGEHADINAQDNLGRTALHYAAYFNNPSMVKLLLKAEVDIAAQDNLGRTALHYAVYFNNPGMVELLLKAGVDINAQDSQGRTALHYAACFNNTGIVKLLLEAGAKTNIKDNNGKRPSSFAKNKEITDLFKSLPARCLSSVIVSCLLAPLSTFCGG